jgi:hypothetical protein
MFEWIVLSLGCLAIIAIASRFRNKHDSLEEILRKKNKDCDCGNEELYWEEHFDDCPVHIRGLKE